MRDVRCSRGRKKCTNTVVLSSSTRTPPGKSHFLRSTRKRPADVDVLLPGPLLLTLWHFSDLTADLLNVCWICLSVCAWLCTHCEFSWVDQNELFVPCSLPKCFNSRLCSPPGTSLSPPDSPSLKPKQPVTQGVGWTGDVPYLEKNHHAGGSAVTWVLSQVKASWNTGSSSVFLISSPLPAEICHTVSDLLFMKIPVVCTNKLWTAPSSVGFLWLW